MNVKDRKDIFKDAIRLFDAAFNQLKIEKTVIRAGSQPHSFEIEGAEKLVQTYTIEDVTIAYYPAEEPKIKAYLQWDKLDLPVKKGQKVGELQLKAEDESVIKTTPLFAYENVDSEWSYKMKQFFAGKALRIIMLVGIVLVILAGVYLVTRSSSRR
jgi:D-alanyl-D-alanine carboxypeptidase (penicillin-binding protein 5/6)